MVTVYPFSYWLDFELLAGVPVHRLVTDCTLCTSIQMPAVVRPATAAELLLPGAETGVLTHPRSALLGGCQGWMHPESVQ